ncbi:acyltransferase [Providencia stuartii]|uniref:acyltransferase n=1 Tax=Providencia stuartii TaxID=588 RepID=UPI0034E46228
MKHKLLLLYSWLIKTVFILFPDTPLLMRLRGFCYSFGMKSCGKNFQISSTANLRGLENITCGNNIYIGPNACVFSRLSIVIEDEVLIAMNTVIVDSNHGKKNDSYRYSRGRVAEIYIEKGAWIAANSVITAGSHIQGGTIVPPCTVVRYK